MHWMSWNIDNNIYCLDFELKNNRILDFCIQYTDSHYYCSNRLLTHCVDFQMPLSWTTIELFLFFFLSIAKYFSILFYIRYDIESTWYRIHYAIVQMFGLERRLKTWVQNPYSVSFSEPVWRNVKLTLLLLRHKYLNIFCVETYSGSCIADFFFSNW